MGRSFAPAHFNLLSRRYPRTNLSRLRRLMKVENMNILFSDTPQEAFEYLKSELTQLDEGEETFYAEHSDGVKGFEGLLYEIGI